MRAIIGILLMAIWVLPTNSLSAQIAKSSKVEELNGAKYYLHTVEKGHTLYSIAKAYNCSLQDIVKVNPDADKGLTLGGILKIPVSASGQATELSDSNSGSGRVHVVKEKETLYGIARLYDVQVNELLQVNEEAIDGLSVGQKLRIPDRQVVLEAETVVPAAEVNAIMNAGNDAYISHKVLKGETLYSIAHRYEVSLEDLQKANGDLPYAKENQTLTIPKIKLDHKPVVMVSSTPLIKDTSAFKDKYHVAVLLPFYLTDNDSLSPRGGVRAISPKSEVAVEFYEGMLIALDSIEKVGGRIVLHVYDDEGDTVKLKQMLRTGDLANMDLIIGPLNPQSFEVAAEMSKVNKTSVVCPVPRNNKVLLGNEFVSKVFSSHSVQMEGLATYLTNKFPDENVVVVTSKDQADITLAKLFMEKRKKEFALLRPDAYKPAGFTSAEAVKLDSLKLKFVKDKPNIIFCPSNNQPFVTDLLTKLAGYCTGYDITVYGTNKWETFDNIDANYLHHLKVHYPSANHFDYHSEDYKRFAVLYREKFKTLPDKFAVTGFDIGLYYFSILSKYGTAFRYELPEYKRRMVAHGFSFFRTGLESGYENGFFEILRFEDYKVVKSNH